MAVTHTAEVPANTSATLLATFVPGAPGRHRWGVDVFDASQGAILRLPRISYGSEIGGADVDQRVKIPAHATDCVFRIDAIHEEADGWYPDLVVVEEDNPQRLDLALRWPRSSESPWRFTMLFEHAA